MLYPDSAHPDSPVANKTVREVVEYAIDKVTLQIRRLWFVVTLWQVATPTCMAYNPDLVGRQI